MAINIKEFATKTTEEIRDDYLRTVKNGLRRLGIDAQVGPGSDYYLRAQALANELTPLYVNTQIKADEQMPDTATGAGLTRQLETRFGAGLRPASPSAGWFVLDASATTTIPSGAQLIDDLNQRYDVQTPGSYDPADLVPIIATDGGAATNHEAGYTLRWVAPPPYCNTKQVVATGGLTGGAEAEDEETARQRLIDDIQNPPGNGNWSQAVQYAEEATPIVQKGFAYPAANGPSTQHIAVVGYASSVSKSREVDAVVMSGTVVPYVLGKMPEFVETVTTTVTDVETDIALGLTLPAAPTASPAGPGGGWTDGTPWPLPDSGGWPQCNVSSVTSTTVFEVNVVAEPTDNVSRICLLDPTNWTLYRAKVLSHTGSAGAWVITIDTPFPNIASLALIASGPFIFPDAINMDTYVAEFLAAMALMGPGEKTANVSVLTRGYRHPIPTASWPYSLDSSILKKVENSGDEVTDTDYYYRSTTTPAVPGSISDPPNILIPRFVGFYPII